MALPNLPAEYLDAPASGTPSFTPGARNPLVLRGVTLADGRCADVTVGGGVVTRIDARGDAPTAGARVEELAGWVLVPSFVEPHVHLDKAFTSDVVPNPVGSLSGAVEAWLAARPQFTVDDIATRARTVAETYLARGATAIRAHVDTGEGVGLRAIEAVASVRRDVEELIDLQIVALCSRPVAGAAGATNRSLLVDALAAGADLVGGAPAFDPDPLHAVDVFAELAAGAGVGLDLHVDETTDPRMFSLIRLADVARDGFEGPVTASHAVSLGQQTPSVQRRVAEDLAGLGVSVVTLPQTNLFLQGRDPAGPIPRGLTCVRTLLDAHVTVAAGADNVQDPFNPMGRVDPAETASLLVSAAHLSATEALTAVTSASRAALGLPPVSVVVGSPADLVALRAPSLSRALAAGPADRLVVRAGRVVARSRGDATTALSADIEERSWW